jgi:three-Cys-motif partner protein
VTDDFFDEQEEQSAVKTAIVAKYIRAWSTIMIDRAKARRVGYVDFYSGPGRFEDGSPSTPLLVLQEAITSDRLRGKLVTIFNDQDAKFIERLQGEVAQLPGVRGLGHQPQFINGPVDEYYVEHFRSQHTIPILSFIDPWGYKGLTRNLVEAVVKDFGSEAIFFFNYSRINAAINNELVEPHVNAIFGDTRLSRLRDSLRNQLPSYRESLLMRELGAVFEEIGARYLIPFRFQRERGTHYICFVSKHVRGYSIMKEIMANLGIKDVDGVPKFEFLPTKDVQQLGFALDIDRPILQLPATLLDRFRGRSLRIQDLIDEHNVGTPFIKPNYKKVLLEMEASGMITCTPSVRKSGTLADHVVVTFPN